MNSKVIVAAAGSGKTTYLIDSALNYTNNTIILTYTTNNESSIKKRLIQKCGHVPKNIVVQTWLSFILEHGVRPFSNLFVNERISGIQYASNLNRYIKKTDVRQYYFDKEMNLYSDRASQFVVELDNLSEGAVINRISSIFNNVLIDEAQDLSGYDYDFVVKLFEKSNVVVVGDPRQRTYVTNHNSKNKSYNTIFDYIQKNCPTLMLSTREEGSALIYQLEYLNAGNVNIQANIQFAHSKENGRETVFEKQAGNTWERLEGDEMTANGNFTARRVYAYSVVPNANENCNVAQIIEQATAGEWVSLNLDCAYGYKVVGATIVTAEGETVTVTGLSFQMPASPITVSLHVEEIIYRVVFKVDGKVWHTAEYRAGEEIVLPEDPTKAPNGDCVYTFIGWGNVPAIAMGEDEELVFEASFMESKTVSDYDTGNNNNVMITIVLPCALAAIILLVAFLIANRIVRKRGGWKKFFNKIGVWIQASSDNLIDAISNLFQPKQKK